MLFALQLLLPVEQATWLPAAWQLLRDAPASSHPEELAHTIGNLARVVRSTVDHVHYGLWEYIAEGDEAEETYNEWCVGTVVDIDEEAQYANDEEQGYAFVTMLFLLEDGGAAQSRIWAESERIPEGEEATVQAYTRFLELIPKLDFRSIRSCAVFVRPGDGGFGVMESMLREEHYHHLVPVL